VRRQVILQRGCTAAAAAAIRAGPGRTEAVPLSRGRAFCSLSALLTSGRTSPPPRPPPRQHQQPLVRTAAAVLARLQPAALRRRWRRRRRRRRRIKRPVRPTPLPELTPVPTPTPLAITALALLLLLLLLLTFLQLHAIRRRLVLFHHRRHHHHLLLLLLRTPHPGSSNDDSGIAQTARSNHSGGGRPTGTAERPHPPFHVKGLCCEPSRFIGSLTHPLATPTYSFFIFGGLLRRRKKRA